MNGLSQDSVSSQSKPFQAGVKCIEVDGKVIRFSEEDSHLVEPYHWRVTEAKPGEFYARGMVNGVNVRMHRWLLSDQLTSGLFGDHKDGDTLNNTRGNLRACTPAQNALNRRAAAGKRWKGVYLYRGAKAWVSRIMKNGVHYYLGSFDSPRKAAAVYNRAARRLHGEFARLNDIGRP